MRKLRLLESALACRQTLLPHQHPDVASAMYLYACAAGDTGDQPLKRDLCSRALESYELHVPRDSLELVPVLVNLAAATIGDSPARRELLERALHIKEHHVGQLHPDLVRFCSMQPFCRTLLADFSLRRACLRLLQTRAETVATFRCAFNHLISLLLVNLT